MFTIKNKIRIISAVILAVSTAAAILSSCGEKPPVIPDETVIGTNGEILGVSVYTEENASVSQTVLYEITTKKKSIFGKKNNDEESRTERKISVRNDSSGVTVISRKPQESTSRVRITFPQSGSPEMTRSAASFNDKNVQNTKHVPVSYIPQTNAPETTKKAGSTTVKQTQSVNSTAKKVVSDEKINEDANGISVVFKTSSVEKGATASVMIQGEPGKKYSIDFFTSPTDIADHSDLGVQTADKNGFVTWTFNVPMNCESGNRKVIVRETGSKKYAQTSINVK